MVSLMREDLLQRLHDLDEEASLLFPNAERIHLIIVGGSALVLMEYISRSTHDIDVLYVSHQIHDLMLQYDMNMRVQTYVNNFPYNYEDRIKRVPIEGKLIDFYTASLEDIIIAKLQFNRDTDYADITTPEVLNDIDWDLLHHLATADDEAHANAMNEHKYNEFLQNYREYEGRYRPCES